MADSHSFIGQYNQGYAFEQQQPHSTSPYVVVDQQPIQREVFPIKLHVNWILGFSIGKCVLGSLLLIAGIVDVIAANYGAKIAIGIWCGLTIIVNGIIGCILKYKQTKCLIGAFLGLSITSLILSISMLSFYSVVLEYFVNLNRIGVTAFLLNMVVLELACSIGSVAVSCMAYSKYCSTCNANDCCTYLGCCECGCESLTTQQGAQPYVPSHQNHLSIQTSQMLSMPPPAYQPNQQRAQYNPCSDFVNFVINVSSSYVFGATHGAHQPTINVNVQPIASNQQASPIVQDRNAEKAQEATSVVFGCNQPNSTTTT